VFESQLLGSFCKQIVPPLTEHYDVMETRRDNYLIVKKRSLKKGYSRITLNIRLRITAQPRSGMALLTKWSMFLQNASGKPTYRTRSV